MSERTILIVDDLPQNIRLLEAVLAPRGYDVVPAASGAEALEHVAAGGVGLVLLDILMPEMDGYEVCRRIRADEASRFLPVVMVTASGEQEKLAAIEAGADDFIAKPFDQSELLARVRSLLRIKAYHDTIEAQAAELAAFNEQLERRVAGAGRRARAPRPAAPLPLAAARGAGRDLGRPLVPGEPPPRDHRGVPGPARLHRVRGDGRARGRHAGAPRVPRGDGRPGPSLRGHARAVHGRRPDGVLQRSHRGPGRRRTARCAWRSRCVGASTQLAEEWRRRGFDLHVGFGVAQGHATLGRIGFEGRSDYAAIGSVTNLAARLCGEAGAGQILISQRVHAATADILVAEPIGELSLRGFSRPIRAFDVKGLDAARVGMSQLVESEPRLSDLSEQERSERFARLQERLVPVWRMMRLNEPAESLVVVPSIAPPPGDMGSVVQAYEERLLFLLLLLRQPLPAAHLRHRSRGRRDHRRLLPRAPPRRHPEPGPRAAAHGLRKRWLAAATDDQAPAAPARAGADPRAASRIASAAISCRSRRRTHERDLALTLGIPLYGADPRHLPLGTKTGCRRLFEEAGVAHPLGREDITRPRRRGRRAGGDARRPGLRCRARIVKLNDGVAGRGNAVVDLQGVPAPGSAGERPSSATRVGPMALRAPGRRSSRLPRPARGGRRHRRGAHRAASSCAARASSCASRRSARSRCSRRTTSCSAGRSGQTYLGCRFPADFGYARAITAEAAKVGERLAREGVLGRFAVDFVVVRDAGGAWTPYAIELNLRKGGTTHPFLTLQFLTDGAYDPGTALFTAPSGREKHLVATDHLESRAAARAHDRRPLRHRVRHAPALRPRAPDRRRVPHDEHAHRARPHRHDRRRRHARAGGLRSTGGRSGSSSKRPSRRANRACRGSDLVRERRHERRRRLRPRPRPGRPPAARSPSPRAACPKTLTSK